VQFNQNGYSERLFSRIKHGPEGPFLSVPFDNYAAFFLLAIPINPSSPEPKSLTLVGQGGWTN
jgi:hypothetical protein